MDKYKTPIFDTSKLNQFVKKDQDESITSNSLRSLNSSCEEQPDTKNPIKTKKLQL